jgi:methyltransferase-like protein/2-polyprenyl-3-methyl-5-hydroxy-6-metoxy-1,4-benzoquinol methylase
MASLITHVSYDEVPYDGGLIEETHPDHLAAIGRLFGMSPVPIETCRVLEIGCASGGNLVPMAFSLPGATFTGIDPANVQLEAARAYARRLGVENVAFVHADIREFANTAERFDFIICHGVFSWVPDDVKEAILAACGRLLAPQGIAFVSYNTLPGFYGRAPIRDAMRFHASHFPETAERISQARAFLEFLNSATQQFASGSGILSTYSELVGHEYSLLRGSQDSYIAHEHLEAANTPYYFHQFAEMLQGRGLQYLGDSQFDSMLVQNLPSEVAEAINQIAANQISLEQYRDFVVNRSFRKSLLCSEDVRLERNISVEAIMSLKFRGRLPDRGDDPWRIAKPGGHSQEVSDPQIIAVLDALNATAPRTLDFEELANELAAKIEGGSREYIAAILLSLLAHGAIEFRTTSPQPFTRVSERPLAFAPARIPGRRTQWTATPFHTTLLFDAFVRYLLPFLDGHHSIADLTQKVTAAIQGGEFVIESDTDSKPSQADIERLVVQSLEQLRHHGLLTA